MGWWMVAFWVGSFILSKLLSPKPKVENARAAGIEEFDVPTATEGRSIPLLWGTGLLVGNTIWSGGLRQLAVEEDDRIVAWNYYLGLHFALCYGEVDAIEEIRINDKIASGGRTGSGGLNIDAPDILGGTSYGSGGVSGNGNFYAGTTTEVVNTYLSAYQNPQPAYRRVCSYVFEGGWVGRSPNLPNFGFRLRRINDTDGLGLAVSNPGAERINNTDANPMNVIYEIMTDTYWGLKINPGLIDVPNFTAAAVTLASEGNGWSFISNGEIEADELLTELERQIDGKVYLNRSLGMYQVKLARADYTPGSLPLLDGDNSELVDFSRKDWRETVNQVTVRFQDIEDNFKETFALAQDMANIQIQGEVVANELRFPGVKNRTLANKLAWRELTTLCYPLAKLRLRVNRFAFNMYPLDVFRYTSTVLGITDMVFRITEIDYGSLDDEDITIYASEDIFVDRVPSFADPSVSSWNDPNEDPVVLAAANTLVFEAGRQWVTQAAVSPGQNPRWWCGGRDPGGGTSGFQIFYRYGTARPLAGAYSPDLLIRSFLLAGELESNVPAYGSSATRPAEDYFIEVNNDLDTITGLLTASEAETSKDTVDALQTVVYINGEFIGFEYSVENTGILELRKLHRGLFNSAPRAHTAGDRVWFVGKQYTASGGLGSFGLPGFNVTKTNGGELITAVISDETQDEVDLQLRSQSKTETLTEGVTPVLQQSLQKMWKAPLPPRDPVLDGVYADTSVTVDTQYLAGTGLTGDNARALKVEATPRSWRVDLPTEDDTLPAGFTDDSPEWDVVLTLDPAGTPVVVPTVTVADTLEAYVLRNELIKAVGDNASIPTTAHLAITAKHTPSDITPSAEVVSPVDMEFDITSLTSSLQGDNLFFGGFAVSTPSATVQFGENGSYAFDIKTALPSSGVLQASINGGGFTTVVGAGLTTGNLAVTSGDNVRLQFTQAPTNDQFFDITGPTSETGHGVLEA